MSTRISFLDLQRLHRSIQPEIDEAIKRVISNSSFVGGMEVNAFEEEFASAHGVEYAASCGSGTDALALALRALGVGPGDEVVVPAMTFVATAEAVVHVGATPVIADVDRDTLLLTPDAVNRVRGPRTRAVIPVHLYGHVVPFDSIDQWKKEGLIVLEDAAQAHIATWRGKYVGSKGDAAAFSFYPGKNLGAFGDGGMVLSKEEEVINEVRRLRDHGRTSKYVHDVPGWCSRLDGIQAAVLRAKLAHLREWTESRRRVGEDYKKHLGHQLISWAEGAVHHLLVMDAGDPEGVARVLSSEGIATGRHYPIALSKQPWLESEANAPNAESAANSVLSLPMDPHMTSQEVDIVVNAVLSAGRRSLREA